MLTLENDLLEFDITGILGYEINRHIELYTIGVEEAYLAIKNNDNSTALTILQSLKSGCSTDPVSDFSPAGFVEQPLFGGTSQVIYSRDFLYSNSQSNCLIFFVTNSLKIVELATLLVLQDNNKT